MTKEELKQYRSIVAELNEVNDRINSNTVYGVLLQALTVNFRMLSTVYRYRVLSQRKRTRMILYYVNDWNGRKIKLSRLLTVY